VEHVLEWQVVTKFFEWVRDNKKTGNIFDNPDLTVRTKIDFSVTGMPPGAAKMWARQSSRLQMELRKEMR
jgi:hypothetical protein